jgi:hypothetical protein
MNNELFSKGAFIVNRTILDEPTFSNPKLLKAWIYCLARANFKDKWINFKIGKGETEILVKRGQFVYGRNKVAEALNFTPSQTDTLFKKLSKFEYIAIESSNQYSVVTILNYNEIQKLTNYEIATKQQPIDNQSQPSNNQSTTNNTNKNDKNEINFNNDIKEEETIILSDEKKKIKDSDIVNFIKDDLKPFFNLKEHSTAFQLLNSLNGDYDNFKQQFYDYREFQQTTRQYKKSLKTFADNWNVEDWKAKLSEIQEDVYEDPYKGSPAQQTRTVNGKKIYRLIKDSNGNKSFNPKF